MGGVNDLTTDDGARRMIHSLCATMTPATTTPSTVCPYQEQLFQFFGAWRRVFDADLRLTTVRVWAAHGHPHARILDGAAKVGDTFLSYSVEEWIEFDRRLHELLHDYNLGSLLTSLEDTEFWLGADKWFRTAPVAEIMRLQCGLSPRQRAMGVEIFHIIDPQDETMFKPEEFHNDCPTAMVPGGRRLLARLSRAHDAISL